MTWIEPFLEPAVFFLLGQGLRVGGWGVRGGAGLAVIVFGLFELKALVLYLQLLEHLIAAAEADDFAGNSLEHFQLVAQLVGDFFLGAFEQGGVARGDNGGQRFGELTAAMSG